MLWLYEFIDDVGWVLRETRKDWQEWRRDRRLRKAEKLLGFPVRDQKALQEELRHQRKAAARWREAYFELENARSGSVSNSYTFTVTAAQAQHPEPNNVDAQQHQIDAQHWQQRWQQQMGQLQQPHAPRPQQAVYQRGLVDWIGWPR